jgi:hypothetical protein
LVDSPRDKTLNDADLHRFFREMLCEVVTEQKDVFSHHVMGYVTDLLVSFHETARLFAEKEKRVPVLADMMSEALEADHHKRVSILRQMGDTSLIVSGYFPEAVTRRMVTLDYYRKMGKAAYSHLDTLTQPAGIFYELSDRFLPLSELINRVSERTHDRNDSVLGLLEDYMQDESEHVLEKLKRVGVIPIHRKKKSEIL